MPGADRERQGRDLEEVFPGIRRAQDGKPFLLYCSVTGFGQDGPYAPRPGYDSIFQGMGDLMSITGEREGQPGAGPQKVGIAITDVLTGMYASLAITAALAHRERTGEGQYIDCALLDTIVAFNANQIVSGFCSGRVPIRRGNAHPRIVPHPLGGVAPVVASPMRLSATPVEYGLAPPLLGQHNDEIYGGLLGKSRQKIGQPSSSGIL